MCDFLEDLGCYKHEYKSEEFGLKQDMERLCKEWDLERIKMNKIIQILISEVKNLKDELEVYKVNALIKKPLECDITEESVLEPVKPNITKVDSPAVEDVTKDVITEEELHFPENFRIWMRNGRK
jgi:hypothetical protein